MDDLTYRTGIDAQGRMIHGGGPLPTSGDRHQNRHRRAVTTMTLNPAELPKLRVVQHADGRRAFPEIVQYDVRRGDQTSREDLPPVETEVPYTAVVHNLSAYEWLKAAGVLEIGHRLPVAAVPEVIDNRVAPQS